MVSGILATSRYRDSLFWKLIETERETSHTVPLRPSPSLSCLSGTVTTLVTAQSGAEQRTETVIPFWNEIDGAKSQVVQASHRFSCNSATPAELSSEMGPASGILSHRASFTVFTVRTVYMYTTPRGHGHTHFTNSMLHCM